MFCMPACFPFPLKGESWPVLLVERAAWPAASSSAERPSLLVSLEKRVLPPALVSLRASVMWVTSGREGFLFGASVPTLDPGSVFTGRRGWYMSRQAARAPMASPAATARFANRPICPRRRGSSFRMLSMLWARSQGCVRGGCVCEAVGQAGRGPTHYDAYSLLREDSLGLSVPVGEGATHHRGDHVVGGDLEVELLAAVGLLPVVLHDHRCGHGVVL